MYKGRARIYIYRFLLKFHTSGSTFFKLAFLHASPLPSHCVVFLKTNFSGEKKQKKNRKRKKKKRNQNTATLQGNTSPGTRTSTRLQASDFAFPPLEVPPWRSLGAGCLRRPRAVAPGPPRSRSPPGASVAASGPVCSGTPSWSRGPRGGAVAREEKRGSERGISARCANGISRPLSSGALRASPGHAKGANRGSSPILVLNFRGRRGLGLPARWPGLRDASGARCVSGRCVWGFFCWFLVFCFFSFFLKETESAALCPAKWVRKRRGRPPALIARSRPPPTPPRAQQ